MGDLFGTIYINALVILPAMAAIFWIMGLVKKDEYEFWFKWSYSSVVLELVLFAIWILYLLNG